MKSGVRRASRKQTLSSDGGDGVAPSRPRGGGLLCGRFGGGLLAESVLQRVEGRRLLLRRHGKERVPGGGRLRRRLRNWRSCWRLDGRLWRRSEGRRGRREARLPGAGRLERGCPCLDLPSESTTMLARRPRNTVRAEWQACATTSAGTSALTSVRIFAISPRLLLAASAASGPAGSWNSVFAEARYRPLRPITVYASSPRMPANAPSSLP